MVRDSSGRVRRGGVLASVAAGLLAGRVVGAPAPGEPPTAGSGGDLLAGPRVEKPVARATLVQRDFEGRIVRLEVTPEERALAFLTLSDREKKAAQEVISRRHAILDGIVADNIPLLVKLSGSGEDDPERFALLGELRRKMSPLLSRGKLKDELRPVLGEANARELDRLVGEYWRALIREGPGGGEAREGVGAMARGLARESLLQLGQEVKRSYERQFAGRDQELDDFLSKVSATASQERKIREHVARFAERTLGNATKQDEAMLAMRILGELEPGQRGTALKVWRGRDELKGGRVKGAERAAEKKPAERRSPGEARDR